MIPTRRFIRANTQFENGIKIKHSRDPFEIVAAEGNEAENGRPRGSQGQQCIANPHPERMEITQPRGCEERLPRRSSERRQELSWVGARRAFSTLNGLHHLTTLAETSSPVTSEARHSRWPPNTPQGNRPDCPENKLSLHQHVIVLSSKVWRIASETK